MSRGYQPIKKLAEDIRRVMEYRERQESGRDRGEEVAPSPVAANVGDMMMIAMAAAGNFPVRCGGSTPCETDYLAASGAVFPKTEREKLEAFNRATLMETMDEAAEMRRYQMIATFFHSGRSVRAK